MWLLTPPSLNAPLVGVGTVVLDSCSVLGRLGFSIDVRELSCPDSADENDDDDAVVVVAAVVGQPLPAPTDAGVSGEEIDHAEK